MVGYFSGDFPFKVLLLDRFSQIVGFPMIARRELAVFQPFSKSTFLDQASNTGQLTKDASMPL